MILSALFGIAWLQQESISKRVNPNPTGANGYEEYLYAADIVDSQAYKDFEEWDAYRQAARKGTPWTRVDENEKPVPPPRAPGRLSVESTNLEVKKAKVKAFNRIFDLVQAGNTKEVHDPHIEWDLETLFPQYAGFKGVAKFLTMGAYVSFAEGRTSEGTERLLTALTFAMKFADGPLICELVSIACQAIALAEFEVHLRSLSELDCQRVIRFMRATLKQPSNAVRTFKSERQGIEASMVKALSTPASVTTFFGQDADDAFTKVLGSMSTNELTQVRERVTQAIETHFAKLIDVASGPESGWVKPISGPSAPDPNSVEKWTPELVGDSLAAALMPVFGQAMQAEAKNRTQLRLLLLHALVLEYRWQEGALPTKLSDAVAGSEIIDPISGKEFKYELQGRNGYRLYSEGFSEIGEIELRYRKAPGGPDSTLREDGDNPPPLFSLKTNRR